MTALNYLDATPSSTTTGPLTAGQTSITVNSAAGWPSAPFTLGIELDPTSLAFTTNTDIGLVTNVAGNVLTVTRGYGNLPAVSHSGGVTVAPVLAAALATEASAHHNATAGIHGVTGAVMGTTDSQTVTNKNLSSGNSLSGTLTGSGTVGGAIAIATSAAAAAASFSGVIAPKSFTTQAVAGTGSAGQIVYLTAPTGSNAVAGLYTWNVAAAAWVPLYPAAVCRARLTTPQTLTSGTAQSITLDTFDKVQFGSAAAAGFTVTYAGLYLATAIGQFVANATGRRFLDVAKNAVTDNDTQAGAPATSAGVNRYGTPGGLFVCAAGDVLEAQAFQDSGGNLALNTAMLTVVQLSY